VPVLPVGDTRSTYGDLARVYLPVALVVFALVVMALAVVALRFRARPGREPSSRMTATRLEGAYIALLTVIAAALLWRSYEAIADVDPVAPAANRTIAGPPTLTIGIVASQWNWRFTYPGGASRTGNGRERYPVLVVPAGRDVRFRLTSQDVVHAFWIPALRAKYDAMPGYVNTFDLRFRPGLDYSTARCSEFCGTYHDQMQFRVQVLEPAAFDAWLRGQEAS
jgi:cytochrome c oxidase subunit II